jgi:hypothetical protein
MADGTADGITITGEKTNKHSVSPPVTVIRDGFNFTRLR